MRFVQTGNGTQIKVGHKYTKKKRNLWMGEVRKLTEKGDQTSIVTTNYKLSIVPIGLYMFARRCQENFSEYMMGNFGMDFLISYLQSDIGDTTELRNPSWRGIDKKVRSLNAKLQKSRAKFGELIIEGDIQESKMKNYTFGRRFINFYYRTSPIIARTISKSNFFKKITRVFLRFYHKFNGRY